MYIKKIQLTQVYHLTHFTFDFRFSENFLQTLEMEKEVFIRIVNDQIYNQFKRLDTEIQVYITRFLSDELTKLKHRKNYRFKIKINPTQHHALLTLNEIAA